MSFDEPKIVTFLNPWSYLQLRNHNEILKRFTGVYFDGLSFAVIFSCLWRRVKRVSFDMTSMAPLVFDHCQREGKRIALIGSQEDEIVRATNNILELFPDLNVVAKRNGFFKNKNEMIEYCEKIASISPDFVVVGMGTPRQEEFLINLRSLGWNGVGFTCGGFFHQTAKRAIYYPKLANLLNFRWLYRLFDEPKLIKRYGTQYPLFLLYFLKDYLTYRFVKFTYNRRKKARIANT